MYKSRMRRLEERVDALENTPIPQPIKIEVSRMNIGENIKNRRKSAGMSQNDLAAAVGVSVPMICQIERGTKSVTLMFGAEIAKIAKILQCDLNDLVNL